MQLVIKNASITGVCGTRDIGIDAGRITAVDPRVEGQADREIDAAGNLVSTGFVDSHMHLDKALVLDRYDWSQRETLVAHRITAMTESDKMKRDFTVDDVRQRGGAPSPHVCCLWHHHPALSRRHRHRRRLGWHGGGADR